MPQPNCIIIHGCPDSEEKVTNPNLRSYDKHWMPWVSQQLEERGMQVERPHMPSPWQPNYERFKAEFEKYKVNDQTILIGHSCGCAFLVRWLGETKTKVAKLILVAPWKIPTPGDKGREDFYTYQIDSTITDRVREIVMFTAENEEAEGKESLRIFQQALGGRVIELAGHGHYTLADMGRPELPELLEVILK